MNHTETIETDPRICKTFIWMYIGTFYIVYEPLTFELARSHCSKYFRGYLLRIPKKGWKEFLERYNFLSQCTDSGWMAEDLRGSCIRYERVIRSGKYVYDESHEFWCMFPNSFVCFNPQHKLLQKTKAGVHVSTLHPHPELLLTTGVIVTNLTGADPFVVRTTTVYLPDVDLGWSTGQWMILTGELALGMVATIAAFMWFRNYYQEREAEADRKIRDRAKDLQKKNITDTFV